jgi:hypothetical protein
MCSPSTSNPNKPKSKSRSRASKSNAEPAGWRNSAALIALSIYLTLPSTASALADDLWNPFAEGDRNKATARNLPPLAPAREQFRRRDEYLAPMTGSDLRGSTAPTGPYATPYPAASDPAEPTARMPYGAARPSPYESRPGTYQPQPPAAPWDSAPAQTTGAATPDVERGELSPVKSAPATASPSASAPATSHTETVLGAWAGLDATTAKQLLSPLKLPPASPAMSDLLARLLATPLADPRLELVRAATLWRSGVAVSEPPSANLADAARGAGESAPLAMLLLTKIDLAAGREKEACTQIKTAVSGTPNAMPANLRGETVVIAGYCAIAAGKPEAGALAAQLARDGGYNRPFALALLDAITAGEQPSVPLTGHADLIDGLLALQLKNADPALFEQLITHADPGLLGYLAGNTRLPGHLALQAAERAASLNVIPPARLAEVYRGLATPATERAALFVAAEDNPAQFQKTRDIRTLLDVARRDGLYHPVAAALTPIVGALPPAQEISWFCETAIEALAAGGDYRRARTWIEFARPFTQDADNLDHWHLLLDIADANLPASQRGAGFRAIEDVTASGRFEAAALHRLVTVLDALDYNVPIPLWNLASRTEQPQSGHLPETGILSALKKTSENGQALATTLFALRTLAPEGTSSTHLLGLGETIRALKRAGLEPQARRLAFEALFADWPRAVAR